MPNARAGGPLSGIRVLDLSSVLMGPYATQTLADFGADVIVIEANAERGNRRMGPSRHDDLSGVALNLLRTKRSVAIDLKSRAGREAALKIAATCDVVVTNMRQRALDALGVDYESVQAVRGDIVYCHAKGFGSKSPRAKDPAYDDIIQAECGLADAAARVAGQPSLAPSLIADKVCGLAVVNAVLAAVVSQKLTGRGQRVELTMIDVMKSFTLVEHGAEAIYAEGGAAGYSRLLDQERMCQRTADGFINILPNTPKAFDAIFEEGGRNDLVVERSELGADPEKWAALSAGLRDVVATKTTEHWYEFCRRHDIPVGRVNTLDDLVAELPIAQHPQVGAYHVIPIPITFDGTACPPIIPAPLYGQHTREVLSEVGLGADELDQVLAQNRTADVVA